MKEEEKGSGSRTCRDESGRNGLNEDLGVRGGGRAGMGKVERKRERGKER